jgi:hypothetical protein
VNEYVNTLNEALSEDENIRNEKCCAVQHPLEWTAPTGEIFRITQPRVNEGAIYLDVEVDRDGQTIHRDDHYIYGMTDVVIHENVVVKDWVVALQKQLEGIVL